jgi:hypothetical protein
MSRFGATAAAAFGNFQKRGFWVAVALVGFSALATPPAQAELIFRLPSIELTGATTGTIDVAIEIAGDGNPAQIAGFNVDFSVTGTDGIQLGTPVIPASNALLPAGTLQDGDAAINARVLAGVDSDPVGANVGTQLLLQVPFEITGSNLTGTFPLQFAPGGFNFISDADSNLLSPTLVDGQIAIVPEPVGGAMLLCGMALFGYATRRRRHAR